jgi:methylmalonyl-CoA/ethylmalonyl-CoA epimerase
MTMNLFTRLDHVAIAVHDADEAASYFRDVLGLAIIGDEIADAPGVRLVYLDAGNTFIQLVAPVRDDAPVAQWLRENQEGLHHICFASTDLRHCEKYLNPGSTSGIFKAGQGASAFFMTREPNNVKIEVTGPTVG